MKSQLKRSRIVLLVLGLLLLFFAFVGFPSRSVRFSQSAHGLDAYDFIEITAQVSAPHAMNPFTGAEIRGTSGPSWRVQKRLNVDLSTPR